MPEPRTYPMSAEKLAELRAELKHKLEVEKSVIAQRLKAAIELGDLSENADYHTAKEDQAFLEGRIQELHEIIRGAVIIQNGAHARTGDDVQLGSRVTVLDQVENEEITYVIVGKVEANPREGRISNESPLGSALLGKKVGDVVRIAAPAGEMVYKVKEIK